MISSSHSRWVLTQTQVTTFWSFYLCMASSRMQTFILVWFWYQGLPLEVEDLSNLAFSTSKPCTSFKCLVYNHLATYICNNAIIDFTLPFWLAFIPFLVLVSNIRWTKGCWWLSGVNFDFWTWTANLQKISFYFLIKNLNPKS